MLRLALLLFLGSTLHLLAVEVVKFGSYSSNMTLEQAKQISGGILNVFWSLFVLQLRHVR